MGYGCDEPTHVTFYVFGLSHWGIVELSRTLGWNFSPSLMGHNCGSLEVSKSERSVLCRGLACEVSQGNRTSLTGLGIQPVCVISWIKNLCVLITWA